METWYTQGPESYTDHPTADAALLDEVLKETFPASDPIATGDLRRIGLNKWASHMSSADLGMAPDSLCEG